MSGKSIALLSLSLLANENADYKGVELWTLECTPNRDETTSLTPSQVENSFLSLSLKISLPFINTSFEEVAYREMAGHFPQDQPLKPFLALRSSML